MKSPPKSIRLLDEDARRVALVSAFERHPGDRWTASDAAQATERALRAEGSDGPFERFLSRRAQFAAATLGERDARLAALASPPRAHPALGPALVLGAFLLGAFSHGVITGNRFNLLAVSLALAALLTWNFVVYATQLPRRPGTRGGRAHGETGQRMGRADTAPADLPLWMRALDHLGLPGRARKARPVVEFQRTWSRWSRPLVRARGRAMLHAAAAAFALGALLALYLRGVVVEVQASWESTFLTEAAVRTVVGLVFAPAAWLLQVDLPSAQDLASLHATQGPGRNAALWIHLYALTVLVAVIVPRSVLAGFCSYRARRLRRALPVPVDGDDYLLQLARAHRGAEQAVLVLPYRYSLAAPALAGLRQVVELALGPQPRLQVLLGVRMGDETALPAQLAQAVAGQGPAHALVVVSMASTPEDEAEGVLLATLREALPTGTGLAVLVDEASFRRRFLASAPSRITERRQAWRQALAPLRLAPVFADLEAQEPQGAAESLRAAWSGGAAAQRTAGRHAEAEAAP